MLPPFNNISSHVSASLLLTLSRCSSSSLLTPILLLLLLLLSAGSPSLKLENTTPKTENKNSHARNATIFHTSATLIFFFLLPLPKFFTLFTFYDFSSASFSPPNGWSSLASSFFCAAPSSFAAYALIFLPIFRQGDSREGGARFHRLFSRIKTYDFLFRSFFIGIFLFDG